MPPSERAGPTRRTPLVLLIVAGALLVARVALGIWYEAHPEDRPDLVTWGAAPAPGHATATGKPVLYVFTDPANADSRRLEREVFGDPGRVRMIEASFAPVRVEGSPSTDDARSAELRSRFGIVTVPSFVVTSPDGGRFRKFTGYSSAFALMDSLRQAQLSMADLPFIRPKGFHFQVGTPPGATLDSVDQVPGR